MSETVVIIRYDEKSRMVLKMEQFFPRTKTWLNQFERLVLRHCPEKERVVEEMYSYLTGTAIPGLPEAARRLDGEIAAAHDRMLATQPKSFAREGAEWKYRQLKSRQKRWPKYCAEFEMNKEVLEQWKHV